MNKNHSNIETSAIDRYADRFEEDGYIVLQSVLPATYVSALLERVDSIWNEHSKNLKLGSKLEVSWEVLSVYPEFVALMSYEPILKQVVQILGWNIHLTYMGLVVNPTQSHDKEPMKYHQDGGRQNFDVEIDPKPRFSLKVAIWLTDGQETGRGIFHVVTGSHTMKKIHLHAHEDPCEATPVFVCAGDAIIFDRRVWHTRKPNHSTVFRKVIFLDYSYRWVEQKCRFQIEESLRSSLTPIEKQLLDTDGSTWSSFAPRKVDVPLKEWALQNGLATE